MRKKSLNKLTLSIGCFLLGAPVMANDFSPYSPAYIVDSGQVLSDTRASVTWVNNRSYDHANAHGYDYPSYSSKNTDLDIGQSFTIGLPEDFQIGASVNYSDLVQANPYQAASRVGELDNPTFFLDKFWNTDSVLWGKVSFSATPKTGDSGAKAAPSMYKIGLSGIYIADESLVTSLGLTQSIVDPIYPDASNATSLNGVASKTLGAYLVNVKLGIQRVEPWLYTSSYTSGSYNSNYQAQGNQSWMYSGGLELSRKIASHAWVGAAYNIGYANRSYTSTFSGSYSSPWYNDNWNDLASSKSSSFQQRLLLSLKAIF